MSMILQFRMLSDEDDNFLRDYEVPYDMSLLDFHRFICDDLGYDPENMTSFFAADERWEKGREFTLMDMGFSESDGEDLPLEMGKVSLSQVIRRNNDRLIYQFDILGDRALYLELTGAEKENEKRELPRLVLANGEAPDQFDPQASPVNRSIFDEVMSDFNDFEGDDNYRDDE